MARDSGDAFEVVGSYCYLVLLSMLLASMRKTREHQQKTGKSDGVSSARSLQPSCVRTVIMHVCMLLISLPLAIASYV